jgi:AraC family L-rhamnose operon regulatory protein RhaS
MDHGISVRKSLEYIENNLNEELDFDAVSKKFNLSPNYFRTLFKEVTGLSPVNYLNRLRIVKSLEYIQTTNCNIAQAAEKVGFYDANYFTRMFKKIIGHPPGYFKK